MRFLLGSTTLFADGMEMFLTILLIVLGVLLAAAGIFAFITRIVVWSTYLKYNKIANSENLTAQEAARKFADILGLQDVAVKKCSWWRAILSTGGAMGFGNNYSIYKKTIFLRRNILNKNSITAVGISTQKVGLAIQDKEGSKMYRFTAYVKPFMLFAPMLFLPLVGLGLVLDLILLQAIGVGTIVCSLIGASYYVLALLIILFTIKVEKKANETALRLMEENNFLTSEERESIKKIYKAYIMAFIADFIIALIEILIRIVKLALKISKKVKK